MSLTIIMPAYNEEACIRDAVQEVCGHVLAVVPGARLLVIDDGSRDGTGGILDELASQNAAVEVLHKANGGHGDSLAFGLNRAAGEYVMLLDSDRQIPLDDFAKHWEQRGPSTMLSGVRVHRQDPLPRLLLTSAIRGAIRCLFGRRIRDGNVPYKIFPRALWEQARDAMPAGSLTPSLFLAILAARDPRIQFVEVPVTHLARRSGKVSLVSWRLVHFCCRAAGQLMRLWWSCHRP